MRGLGGVVKEYESRYGKSPGIKCNKKSVCCDYDFFHFLLDKIRRTRESESHAWQMYLKEKTKHNT
jgi:hypothetical protein